MRVRGGLRISTAVSLALVLALSGCTSIAVFLGLRTRLSDVPVTAVSASLPGSPALAPGQSSRLAIVAATADGRRLATVGPAHGDVVFDSFTFDAHIVQVKENGVVTLPPDPRLSEGQMPHLKVHVVGHPEVTADLDIPVRYNVAFTANFSGREGIDGLDGTDGFPGMSGMPGSLDESNPTPGGDGFNGGDGGDGFNGGDGEAGKQVHIWLRLKPGPQPLLQARVAGGGDEQLFLIDPNGGTLAVSANGGPGGRGGHGGKGGPGGAGGSGSPQGSRGANGHDGADGFPGQDGAAGTILVSVDPEAMQYLDRLRLVNKDGIGRTGPAPRINTETVAPIW
ncbi:MAG: hypothetical protein P4L83_20765 [Nevskia sp.]|nr:hypothetical protein [Nevskia sp.]